MRRKDMMRRLVSAAELSEYLGLPEKTVYRWARAQQLPSLHLGKLVRFDLRDIDRWIEAVKHRAVKKKNRKKGVHPSGKGD